MVATLLTFVTGGGAGVITGLFSSVFGGLFGFLGSKARQKHDLAMTVEKNKRFSRECAESALERDHELATMSMEADKAEKLAIVRKETKEQEFAGKAFMSSIAADAATYSKGWQNKVTGFWAGLIAFLLGLVDVARGLTRVVITGVCAWILVDMWRQTYPIVNAMMANNEQFRINYAIMIVSQILFIVSMTIGWWFGNRPTKPPREIENKLTSAGLDSSYNKGNTKPL